MSYLKTESWKKSLKSSYSLALAVLLFLYSDISFSQTNEAPQAEIAESKPELTLNNEPIQNNETKLDSSNQTDLWSFLHPYRAKYKVLYNGSKVGNAYRELTYDENQWSVSAKASVSKLFYKINSNELTEFAIDGEKLFTNRFYSSTKRSFKKERKMEQFFDWENNVETGYKDKNKWNIEIDGLVYDRISHIIQLRSNRLNKAPNLSFDVSYKGKKETFKYTLEGIEAVQTKMGKLSAEKLVRKKPNGDTFVLWLSPDLNYLPVKIGQYEVDKSDVVMILDSIDYTATE